MLRPFADALDRWVSSRGAAKVEPEGQDRGMRLTPPQRSESTTVHQGPFAELGGRLGRIADQSSRWRSSGEDYWRTPRVLADYAVAPCVMVLLGGATAVLIGRTASLGDSFRVPVSLSLVTVPSLIIAVGYAWHSYTGGGVGTAPRRAALSVLVLTALSLGFVAATRWLDIWLQEAANDFRGPYSEYTPLVGVTELRAFFSGGANATLLVAIATGALLAGAEGLRSFFMFAFVGVSFVWEGALRLVGGLVALARVPAALIRR